MAAPILEIMDGALYVHHTFFGDEDKDFKFLQKTGAPKLTKTNKLALHPNTAFHTDKIVVHKCGKMAASCGTEYKCG
jgi:hypothetical protein